MSGVAFEALALDECLVCGVPIARHLRCLYCGILMGAQHLEPSGDNEACGTCQPRRATHLSALLRRMNLARYNEETATVIGLAMASREP
jgi:ribosomal protein L32